MKKVSGRTGITLVFSFLLLSLLTFTVNAQEAAAADETAVAEAGGDGICGPGDPVAGKQLFNQNCAACHALNRKMTGPALANVATRLT